MIQDNCKQSGHYQSPQLPLFVLNLASQPSRKRILETVVQRIPYADRNCS